MAHPLAKVEAGAVFEAESPMKGLGEPLLGQVISVKETAYGREMLVSFSLFDVPVGEVRGRYIEKRDDVVWERNVL